ADLLRNPRREGPVGADRVFAGADAVADGDVSSSMQVGWRSNVHAEHLAARPGLRRHVGGCLSERQERKHDPGEIGHCPASKGHSLRLIEAEAGFAWFTSSTRA